MSVSVIVGLLFALFAPVANAQSGMATVRLYTSMPIAKAEQLVATFETLHPDIDVQLYRTGTPTIIEKVRLEKIKREPSADVILIADEINMELLKAEGFLMAYPEAPVESLPPGSFDAEMTYFGTKAMSTALIFDPAKTPRVESWRDLERKTAAPVAIVNPLGSGSALANLWHLSDTLGWDYYRKLADNGARIEVANGKVLKTVTEGKAAYGMVLDYMAVGAINAGASIELVYPKEGVVVTYQPVAIAAKAQNIDGAKALIDFLLSDKGQQLVIRQGYRPLLDDMDPPPGYPTGMSTFTFRPVDGEAAAKQAEQLGFKFNTIFHN